jgi:hypothetical protein
MLVSVVDTVAFRTFCDAVALLYHEGRNVRHLIRRGLIQPEKWRFLVSLPTNREDAWRTISVSRDESCKQLSVDGALTVWLNRFKVSINDLAEMFANANWRHAKSYGGNAWAEIAGLTAALSDALKNEEFDTAKRIVTKLQTARHNNGLLIAIRCPGENIQHLSGAGFDHLFDIVPDHFSAKQLRKIAPYAITLVRQLQRQPQREFIVLGIGVAQE